MKYLALEYTGPMFDKRFNLGEDIQAIAISRLLPRVDGYVSREALDTATGSGIIPPQWLFHEFGPLAACLRSYPGLLLVSCVASRGEDHMLT